MLGSWLCIQMPPLINTSHHRIIWLSEYQVPIHWQIYVLPLPMHLRFSIIVMFLPKKTWWCNIFLFNVVLMAMNHNWCFPWQHCTFWFIAQENDASAMREYLTKFNFVYKCLVLSILPTKTGQKGSCWRQTYYWHKKGKQLKHDWEDMETTSN